MNHLVPDFHEMEADFAIPASGNFSRPRKTTLDEDEIVELVWQNGQVVVQNSANKPPYVGGGGEPAEQAVGREIRGSAAEEGQHLFMQEDEMASWLQYPIEDSSFTRDLYADDLFYTAPITSAAPTHSVAEIRPQPAPPRPPIPPPPQKSGVSNSPRVHTFGNFSRLPSRPRIEPASRPLLATVRESTVVESNETPMAAAAAAPDTGSNSRRQVYNNTVNGGNATGRGELGGVPCELTVTSSLDGGASFSATARPNPPNEKAEAAEDRKRKAREDDDNECQSEDFECEAAEANKKQSRGSTSTKRSRAAEVHNLSERRRRDRINEKMKALQELIPRCNKSDKASMLDEAIEYMKSLQMQLQMMSMGCGMVPMMYPGMQQYMPAMVMGMGMNRPMMPSYPSMIPGSPMQNPTIGPRFPMPPGFHLPQVPLPDNNSRVEGSNSNNPAPKSLAGHNTNQQRAQNFVDLYQQQFIGLHQPQSPSPQNQGVVQLTAKQNTNKEDRHPENKQSDRK